MFCLPCVEATALLDQQNNNTESKWYLLVKSKSDKRNITVLFGQHKPQTHCLLLAALLHLYLDSLFGIYRHWGVQMAPQIFRLQRWSGSGVFLYVAFIVVPSSTTTLVEFPELNT